MPVITLPDGRPVWGGTYFRKDTWINSLEKIQKIYQENPQRLIDYATQLEEGIKSMDLISVNTNELNCLALEDPNTFSLRKAKWEKETQINGGTHPSCGTADTRLLHSARHSAVPASRGGGIQPNRKIWVREPREAKHSGFFPSNKSRPGTTKEF